MVAARRARAGAVAGTGAGGLYGRGLLAARVPVRAPGLARSRDLGGRIPPVRRRPAGPRAGSPPRSGPAAHRDLVPGLPSPDRGHLPRGAGAGLAPARGTPPAP